MADWNEYYPEKYRLSDWLPTTKKEVEDRGWDQLDVIIFTGDAYVDHPAFGAGVIGRVLEKEGYKIAIVPQPNWRDDLRDFTKLGQPRLFFGVTSGNMDSMVNHYTANRRLRSNDAYTPGDKSGFRPDRATSVYADIIRKLYPESTIIAGGIEASLRRLIHYDYWDDQIHPSILDSGSIDYLMYGNAEKTVVEAARILASGAGRERLRSLPQVAYFLPVGSEPEPYPDRETVKLHPYADVISDKPKYAANFRIIEEESNVIQSKRLIQDQKKFRVVVNPPHPPAATEEMDAWHDLPFTRLPHPRYWKKPVIPAFEMIRFSVNIHRGCFGGCSFCTISAHQGKHVSSRSEGSILKEIRQVTGMPGFKGYLSDVGGPSANMYRLEPFDRSKCRRCKRASCVHPGLCNNINLSHKPLIRLYERIRELPEIKKAFVSSGIRYDLFLNERSREDPSLREYPVQLISHHVSGRLKVAPEHTRREVLNTMRKPGFEKFHELKRLFDRVNQQKNMRQELIPYFISSHPACSFEDMVELAVETKSIGVRTEQVQDFTPTPMTLATTMFHTGLDPYSMKPVFVAKTQQEKLEQRSLFFHNDPAEKQNIIKKLNKSGRQDLIERLYGMDKLKHVKSKPGHKRNHKFGK
jgi:uncharacterized radical SAM protein YgiQ